MVFRPKRLRNCFLLSLFFLLWNSRVVAGEIQYDPPRLKQKLNAALAAKGKEYQPRTQYLLEDGRPAYVNRLILEDSPYLIQHAHNPVNWFSWGDKAFAKAKRENKPVFLSIGYSTCHWCHVMEHESFDNLEIAKLLNEHFVSIKVDRERRPDVDAVYMMAVQMITGRGGWPMSSFLTPEGKTFLGGTYFPPDKFKKFLLKVSGLWQKQQLLLIDQAERVATAVSRENESSQQARKIDRHVTQAAVKDILQRHDIFNGGFGQAPKFPHEAWLMYLLESAQRSGNSEALNTVETSLKAMAKGGIYDQIGGGFHRYSVDEKWLVTHFEKMLYTQALLARTYLYAYRLTDNLLYARIAQQTLDYVLRDMTSPEGGFYSASDADNEEGEGVYYLWTIDQINQSLEPWLAGLAIDLFGMTEQGNFEGKNILNLPSGLDAYSRKHEIELPSLYARVDQIREQLDKVRRQRIPPFRDDKIITAWNAMMVETLAIASEILDQPEYLEAAERAANFIWKSNRRKPVRLWRVNLHGHSSIKANQEDYAYLAEALLQLYDVNEKPVWLKRARRVTDAMIGNFWDKKQGGFFMNTAKDSGTIMVRPKSIQDSSIPSSNAVALRVLARLARRVADPVYEKKAAATLSAFSSQITSAPVSYSSMLLAAIELNAGESGPHQYAARGAVSVKANTLLKGKEHWLEINFQIKPKWHINAHRPLQDYLIPTTVSLADGFSNWQLSEITYPAPLQKKLGFQKEILALYERQIQLHAKLIKSDNLSKMLPVQIKLQACNDKVCLPPEKLNLNVPVGIDDQ